MKLLMVSILMAIPALMVSICLTNKAKLIRILNFVFGIFYALVMMLTVASSISEWRIFYIFLAILEIGVAIIIVWHAWKWPKQSQMA